MSEVNPIKEAIIAESFRMGREFGLLDMPHTKAKIQCLVIDSDILCINPIRQAVNFTNDLRNVFTSLKDKVKTATRNPKFTFKGTASVVEVEENVVFFRVLIAKFPKEKTK